MRSKKAQLSADDSRLLRDIVETAGLDRRELSNLSEVSTGWLSQLLQANGQQSKTVNANMVARLASVLVKQITSLPADSSLPEERLKTVLGFLSRYTDSAAKLMPPKIYTAGGPIPVDADHYIKRPYADGKLPYALQSPAFNILVRGPVQSGKSSLLAQLEHQARAKGIETAWFDPWAAVSSVLDAGKQPADIFALTATHLAKTLAVEWKLEPPSGGRVEFKEELSGWFLSALTAADRKPRLLILDDLGRLGAELAEKWLSFIRLIDTKRASRDIKISFAVGMTHIYGPYFARLLERYSSIVNWEPRIELRWLYEEETKELERILAGRELNLYKFFHGQPYLTHAAATNEDFRKGVEEWANTSKDKKEKHQSPVMGASPYKRHLKAIKLALLGPPWQDQSPAHSLVKSFVELCNRSDGPDQSTTESTLPWNDMTFLKTAKLIDEDKPELDLYCLIANDIMDQIHLQ